MKVKQANIKSSNHLQRWRLAKVFVLANNQKCPQCTHKTIFRSHDWTFVWCWTCSWSYGSDPTVTTPGATPSSTTSTSYSAPPVISVIRQMLPDISLQDAFDVLRAIRRETL